ncbi:MAG: DMT family transporter [Patescibacteria group bacterium]|nr:DMT family transporter [Patescibacteria group bacterium]
MNPSIIFGLLAMFGWGVGNFTTGVLSKKVDPFKLSFIVHTSALPLTVLLLLFFKYSISIDYFFLLSILGITASSSYFTLSKSLQTGTISVISTIIPIWAIFTSVLSFLFLEEEIYAEKVLGILIVISGVLLVSADFEQIKKKAVVLHAGTAWAFLSAFVMGLHSFLVALFTQKFDWFSVTLTGRIWTFLVFLILAFFSRKRLKNFFIKVPKLVIALILLETIVIAVFNRGLELGEPSVVATIASATPLVAVPLAFIFFKEKLKLYQIFGMLLSIVGIGCLSFGG